MITNTERLARKHTTERHLRAAAKVARDAGLGPTLGERQAAAIVRVLVLGVLRGDEKHLVRDTGLLRGHLRYLAHDDGQPRPVRAVYRAAANALAGHRP